jgi:hypothetical protein
MDEKQPAEDPPKKKRGRPPGVKNKPKGSPEDRLMPPSLVPFEDYKHPDPLAMVSRLYTECDWAMQALSNEMKKGLGHKEGQRVSFEDAEKLARVAASLEKTIVTHGRALKLMAQLRADKTPEQMLRIAINKIKGQSLATQRAILVELKEHIRKLGPIGKKDKDLLDIGKNNGTASLALLAEELAEEPPQDLDEELPNED